MLSIYTTLHEAGHALAVWVYGGHVIEFNINFFNMHAHITTNGHFTSTQMSVVNISGMLLPLFIWGLALLIIPRKATPLAEIMKLIASLIVVNTLLAWIIIPILVLINCAPPHDDVTQFIYNSGIPSLAATFLFFGVYILSWVFTFYRIDNINEVMRAFYDQFPEMKNGHFLTIIALASLTIIGGSMTLTACQSIHQIPQGFSLASSTDLNRSNHAETMLTEFTLMQPTLVGIIITVDNINTEYIDVSLNTPGSIPLSLLHGEGFNTAYSSDQTQHELKAGTYRIMLTSKKSAGILKIYINIP